MAQTAPRHAHDHRHAAAPPIADLRGVVDELIEAGRDEIVELDLADRPLTGERRADADAEHRAFGERRVDRSDRRTPSAAAGAAETRCRSCRRRPRRRRTRAGRRAARRRRRASPPRETSCPWGRTAAPASTIVRQVLDAGGRPDRLQRISGSSTSTCARGGSSANTPAPASAGIRPRRVDDRARLRLDDRFGLALEPVEIARVDDAVVPQPRRVRGNRIARRPVLVQLAIGVALLGQRRIVPGRLRILARGTACRRDARGRTCASRRARSARARRRRARARPPTRTPPQSRRDRCRRS